MKRIDWINLEDENQIETIIESSNEKSIGVFKHSTRCIISKMALDRFEREYERKEKEVELYFLDLIRYRTISDKISTVFKVQHESPQLLIIRNGKTVHHSSHDSIKASIFDEV